MTHLIQKFIYIIGGFTRWLFSNFMNIVFSKNRNSDIGYYLFEENNSLNNKTGLDSDKTNFVVGILMIILFFIILTKCTEN